MTDFTVLVSEKLRYVLSIIADMTAYFPQWRLKNDQITYNWSLRNDQSEVIECCQHQQILI